MAIATSSEGNVQNAGCLMLFGPVFAICGTGIGISTARKLILGTGNTKQSVLGFSLALIFLLAGIALFFWGRGSTKSATRRQEVRMLHPGQPWLWREDWAQGYAQAEWQSTATVMTVIGVAFLLFSVPMLVNLPAELWKQHPFQIALVLFFPVAGIYLTGQSLLAYLRARKFKKMRLCFSSVPCVIGGKLQGQMETDFVFPPGATVDLKLSCVRSYVSGSGENRTRWERILWQDPKSIAVSTDGYTSYAPIEFTIPFDAKETDSRNPDDQIFWKLTAASKLPGLDFSAVFIVPAFKTAASDPTLTGSAIEANDAAQLDAKPPESRIATGIASDGGLRFYIGAARNKQAAALCTLFGAIFLGSGLFFGFASGQTFSWIIGLIPITLAGGMGLLLIAFGCWLWFGTKTIEVLNRELHVRTSFLGIARSRVMSASTIQDFQIEPNLQVGDQVCYDLKLKLANGRSVTAAGELQKTEAEWLRLELKRDLGIGT